MALYFSVKYNGNQPVDLELKATDEEPNPYIHNVINMEWHHVNLIFLGARIANVA